MAKDYTKRIFVLVSVIVVGYIALTMFSNGQTGFVTGVGCQGNPILELSPTTVQAGENIYVHVAGLSGCANKIVYVKDGDCNSETITSYNCGDKICSRQITFQKYAPGTTQITVCIDKNGNDWFFDPGERSTATLTVVSQPDLTVGGIIFNPAKPADRQTIKTTATIKNLGTITATNAEVKLKIAKVTGSVVTEEIKSANVPAKGQADITFRGVSLTKGTYTIEVTADPNNKFVDFDTTNNKYTTTLTVV